jgi:demethoxyubiquinone hydroxylase (CLK1/Coq7/Cat5 family)
VRLDRFPAFSSFLAGHKSQNTKFIMALMIRVARNDVLPSLCRALSSQPSSRYLQGLGDESTKASPDNLTASQREILDAAVRVDQAGEIAANWIYKGQLAVLGRDPKTGPVIQVSRHT